MNRKKQAWVIAQSAFVARFEELDRRHNEGKTDLTDDQWSEVKEEMNTILRMLIKGEKEA